MREDWDNLRSVLHLVREGSLAGAARVLGVSYTTVARRVEAAEVSLGTRLFNRLPGGYAPTAAGREAARHAETMEAAQFALRRNLGGRERELVGPFTVTAPELLIATHLCHVIEAFIAEHPQIELTVRAAGEVLDLNRREADLAIRVSNDPGDALVGQRLTRQQTASFAAPGIAARIRDDPEAMIDWIGLPDWREPPRASLDAYPHARIRLRFDDMPGIIAAAQAGLGVARMPVFIGRSMAGLVPVPILPPQPYADIWLLSHRDMKASAKVRAFKEVLLPFFRSHAADFVA
ncbi:LysR family transcriptional regulator [Maritimibacter sp. 55A14]|uniref:LysR family transcriptional regulator n=1 Tax=Maritimibacter sp. 55A14 TaxID=2174844 RepID=UPI000D6224EE|nr:LysR family transcriptional regulator [Maritimibacter sp. 55A14]PWE29913.1 LysR family transcriptional regulator [Maritimibacter sp. 55A14]